MMIESWSIEITSIHKKTGKEHLHVFETKDKIYALRYATTYKKRNHEIININLTKRNGLV